MANANWAATMTAAAVASYRRRGLVGRAVGSDETAAAAWPAYSFGPEIIE